MTQLYANENFPYPVVESLRDLGHDVITVAETGKSNQSWPDDAVLEFASHDERGLLTLNRKHFIRLHQSGVEHAGIIVCTIDLDASALAHRIDVELRKTKDLAGQLLRVNRPAKDRD